jgi:hypothetical protein
MTVAASILLAAVIGGIVFVLIDGWQHRRDEPQPAPPAEPPREARTEPLPRPAAAQPGPRADAPPAPSPLWSGWADRDGAG